MRISDWSSDVCSSDLFCFRAVSHKCPFLVPLADRLTDTALEDIGDRLIVTGYRVDICLDPLALIDLPPADLVAGVHNDVIKQDPLRASVSFPDRKSTRLNSSH